MRSPGCLSETGLSKASRGPMVAARRVAEPPRWFCAGGTDFDPTKPPLWRRHALSHVGVAPIPLFCKCSGVGRAVGNGGKSLCFT